MERSFGKGQPGTPESDLLDDSILRQTENEIINQIAIKVAQIGEIAHQSDCENERLAILDLCRTLKFCKPSHIRASLEEMCQNRNLYDMTWSAVEQLIMIFGVISLCMGLYIGLCVLEKIAHTIAGKEEQKYD